MALIIRKAERKKAKLRLGLSGPSGAGKTYSALEIAFGIGGPVGLIDTENGSGDLYAHLGDYDVCPIEAPFTVEKYLEAIHALEDHLGPAGTIILDSLSHAWAGEGGLLEQVDAAAAKGSGGNKFAAWRNVSPQHNRLVEALLQSKCHIIATTRAKSEYVQEKDDRGKTVVKKIGMASVQRDGLEYEFTVFLDINQEHAATASKDRTGLLDGKIIRPSRETGKYLLRWLNAGEDARVPIPEQSTEEAMASFGGQDNHSPAPVNDERHTIPPKKAEPQRATTATEEPAPARDVRKVANDRLWKIASDNGKSIGLGREDVIAAVHQVAKEKYKVESLKDLGPDQLTELGDHFEQEGELLKAHHRFVGAQSAGEDDIPDWSDDPPAGTNGQTGEVTPPIDDVELWLAICDAMPDAGDEARMETLNAMAKARFGAASGVAGLVEGGRKTLTKELREKTGEMLALANVTLNQTGAA